MFSASPEVSGAGAAAGSSFRTSAGAALFRWRRGMV